MAEKAYESVTFGEAGTGVLEIPKVAIEGIWRFSEMSNAQSPNTSQLVQQGIEQYKAGNIQGAIASWQIALTAYQRTNNLANEALVQEKLAIAYQQMGQFEPALNYWKQAIANYRQLGDFTKVGRLLTEQAQTYSRLGRNREAIALLCGTSETNQDCIESEGSALQIARKLSDRAGEAAALGSLGEAYRLRGQFEKAVKTLEASLKITQDINLPLYRSSVFNSLGNAYFSKAQFNEQRANSARLRFAENKANEFKEKAAADYQQALNYFNCSLDISQTQNDQFGQMRTLLNLIQLYSRPVKSFLPNNSIQAEQIFPQALTLLENLPDSINKVYATIDLTELEQPVSDRNYNSSTAQCLPRRLDDLQAEKLLQNAIAIAERLQDSRSQSFALGKLAHLYECRKDYKNALEFTQKARLAADQNFRSKDSLYLWEWQAGRIFKAQGKESEANNAYERAIRTLEDIRDNLLLADRDFQFNFRDTISPLYREFAQLKLEQAEALPITNPTYQKELDSALDAIDSLKLAELQNYFGNDCVFTVFDKERVDDLETKDTAVFSSIFLEDRTEIVVSLPNLDKNLKPNSEKRLKKLVWAENLRE